LIASGFDTTQKNARGSITLKIVPSYRHPPVLCEVIAMTYYSLMHSTTSAF